MTICLRLSDAEATRLDDLIQQYGIERAHQRSLAQRAALLRRDSDVTEPTSSDIIALVSVKLKLAQIHDQCEQRDAEYDAHALFASIQLP